MDGGRSSSLDTDRGGRGTYLISHLSPLWSALLRSERSKVKHHHPRGAGAYLQCMSVCVRDGGTRLNDLVHARLCEGRVVQLIVTPVNSDTNKS